MNSQSETLLTPSVICPPRTVCLSPAAPAPILIDDSDSEESSEEQQTESSSINSRGRKRQREDDVNDRRKRLRTSLASEASNPTDDDVIDLTSDRDIIDIENVPAPSRPVSSPMTSRNASYPPSNPYALRSFNMATALDFLFNSLPSSLSLRSLGGYSGHNHSHSHREPEGLEDRFGGGYWSRRRQQPSRGSNSTSSPPPQGSVTVLDLEDEQPSTARVSAPSTSPSSSAQKDKPSTETKSASVSDVMKDLKCPVCLCPCENITATVCGHIFCEGCILRSIEEQRKCPVCRCSLSKKSIHPLFF